jgi:hypothetical protein
MEKIFAKIEILFRITVFWFLGLFLSIAFSVLCSAGLDRNTVNGKILYCKSVPHNTAILPDTTAPQ